MVWCGAVGCGRLSCSLTVRFHADALFRARVTEVRSGGGLLLAVQLSNEVDSGKVDYDMATNAFNVLNSCQVIKLALEAGLVCAKAGDNAIRLCPPLIIEHSHIDFCVSTLQRCITSDGAVKEC